MSGLLLYSLHFSPLPTKPDVLSAGPAKPPYYGFGHNRFRFRFELPPLVILRRSFNEEECVLRSNLFFSVVLCIFHVRMEATSSDPSLEADSVRSRESDNTEQICE
ncbi:hypothetical protein PIB30_023493 [Stylosanthes scabra]|uniref:Uncharacterized protein n=1 Tax=Stylosanthes scabra TaxID=79078 RepID=A0ABU6S9S5_9FABA|nr:hypothetical protein [Stylosanthes scabra]